MESIAAVPDVTRRSCNRALDVCITGGRNWLLAWSVKEMLTGASQLELLEPVRRDITDGVLGRSDRMQPQIDIEIPNP